MATSALSGKTGTATNVNSATEVTEWSITLTEAVLPATSFDSDGWEEVIAGLKGATGSISGKGTMPTTGTASSLALANSAGTISISGNAVFSSVNPTNSVEDVLTWSADFTFTGEVMIVV